MATSAGPRDYYADGDFNAVCSMCGRKFKGSELLQHWQGLWRCARCWEPRHPQDFIRGIPDNPTPPFVQIRQIYEAGVCTLVTIQGVVDVGAVDCMVVQ
jgi:hypothetical protein